MTLKVVTRGTNVYRQKTIILSKPMHQDPTTSSLPISIQCTIPVLTTLGMIAAKPTIFSQTGVNPRLLRRCVADRSNVVTNLPFPLKTTFPCLKLNNRARALQVHASMTSFLSIPDLSERRRTHLSMASKKYYPLQTKKPEWWLRSLSFLPYLLPFIARRYNWPFAHPHHPSSIPLLEFFNKLTFPLIKTFNTLPLFLRGSYAIILYYGIVRRKEFPHFLRFHVMMSILLGFVVQRVGVSGDWFPTWALPPQFWCAATVLLVVLLLEGIKCALSGSYSGLPFIKDAAFQHSDLNQR